MILSEFGRDSGQSLDSVRTASKSKKKPLTASSDGHESPRWREGAAAPRDAEIMPRELVAPHVVQKLFFYIVVLLLEEAYQVRESGSRAGSFELPESLSFFFR